MSNYQRAYVYDFLNQNDICEKLNFLCDEAIMDIMECASNEVEAYAIISIFTNDKKFAADIEYVPSDEYSDYAQEINNTIVEEVTNAFVSAYAFYLKQIALHGDLTGSIRLILS